MAHPEHSSRHHALRSSASPPNIVLCMCDQLRAFDVGCYGSRFVHTPNMDRLAQQGVRVATAVSNNPVCLPARSILLAGQHTRTCTGILGNALERGPDGSERMPLYPPADRPHLPDPALPELLREQGYATAAIGKWHVHASPKRLGFDQHLIPRVYHRHTGQRYREGGGDELLAPGYSPDWEAERMREYLASRAAQRQPFFLYYNISPPHMPLADMPERYRQMYAPEAVELRPNVWQDGQLPWDEDWFRIYLWDFLHYLEQQPTTQDPLPEGFDLRHLTALYCGAATWVDDLLGRLMTSLDAAGLADNTLLLFTSDHGDNLGSHHRFNKGRLLEESIRIPMLARWPGQLPADRVSMQVTGLVDVMPTLLELAGASVPAHVQGHSVARQWRGEAEARADNHAFIETANEGIGIRTATHLYGLPWRERDAGHDVGDRSHAFYDLRSDPYQQRNLADSEAQRDIAAALDRTLRQWHDATPWRE